MHTHSAVSDNTADTYGNCSVAFDLMDTNHNSFVGLHEAIVALAMEVNFWGFADNVQPQLKIQQINCSLCIKELVTDEDFLALYYM